MKISRRLLRAVTVLVTLLIFVFAFSSCDTVKNTFDKITGKHEHEYTAKVTDPTCREEGFTTYTCSCGESYKDDYVPVRHNTISYEGKAPTCTEKGYADYEVCLRCDYNSYKSLPALGHNYEEKVTKFPTTLSEGTLSKICEECGLYTDKPISTVNFTLPGVAKTFKELVGANTTVVNARDTDLIIVKELDNGSSVSERKQFVAIDLAYLKIDGEAEAFYAIMHLDLGVATYENMTEGTVPSFDDQIVIDVVVLGEEVFVTIEEDGEVNEEQVNLSELFYDSLASSLNVSDEQLNELLYMYSELAEKFPIAEALLGVEVTDLEDAIKVVFDALVVEDDNGYYLDVTELANLVLSLEGRSVAELIDAAFGEGTVEKLEDTALSLPDLKIREIADYVVEISEEFGIDTDDLYALVNYVVFNSTGTEFNIESEIITRYDKTLVEVIAELSDSDAEDVRDDIISGINEVVDTINESDIDAIYRLLVDTADDFSITESLAAAIAEVAQYIDLSWTYNGDKLSSLDFELNLNDNLFNLTVSGEVSGEFEILFGLYDGADKFAADLLLNGEMRYTDNGADGKTFEIEVYEGDERIALVEIVTKETENGLSVTYNIEGLTLTFNKKEYTGGGSVSDSDDEPVYYDGSEVTITFYHTMGYRLQNVLEEYIAQFNELYPDITIKHESLGDYNGVRDQIKTEISVGNQPNLAYCYPDHVALYNIANVVQTLDAYIDDPYIGFTQAELDDFIDGFYDEGRSYGDGKMYSLPLSRSTEVLYYNRSFFEEHGLTPPTTWEEMEDVCRRIKEIAPTSIPLGYDSEANWFITMCEQYGSPYTSATGENFLFNNQTNIDFVTEFRSWYKDGLVTTQDLLGGYTSDIFTTSNCYMVIGSNAGASYHQPSYNYNGYEFEVGITSIPQVNPEQPKVISQGPSLCIFKKDNPQQVAATWLFVKFLTTNADFQAEFSMSSGYMPVIRSVKDNPVYAEFLASASTANINAYSLSVALAQEDAYFASPAFNGSSVARDQVGLLMQRCFTLPNTDVEAAIRKAFEDAFAECKYQSGQ